MEWREFLRPNKRKIKIALIVFLIFPAPTYNIMRFSCIMSIGCFPITFAPPFGVISELFQLSTNPDARQHLQVNPTYYSIVFSIYVILFGLSYILSCWFVRKGYEGHDMFMVLVFVILIGMAILNVINGFLDSNFVAQGYYVDPYDRCETYCQTFSARYSSVETALIATQSSEFCQDPNPYDSIDGNCVEHIGECEISLTDGTTITVGCD